MCVFFFKQKTAYEMRISDWSSDVCSSDLGAVKAPIDILGLSNGARAGLTGFVAGLARKTVIDNVTINNLLPGPFDTDRLRHTMTAAAEKTGRSLEEVARERATGNPAGDRKSTRLHSSH